MLKLLIKASFVSLLLIVAGCASNSEQGRGGEPARHQLSDFYQDGDDHPADVHDPFEGFNRGMYKFNAAFDEAIFLPVVYAYKTVTPKPVRTGVSNFFTNIGEITTFANEVLQFKLVPAGKTVFRFVTNSTMGFFGLFDVTSDMGIFRTEEDFGQTLGFWGVGHGPYLVLPILGPSNIRDTAGLVTDTVAFSHVDPLDLASAQGDHPEALALRIIDQRYGLPIRYYQTGSPFEYYMIRFLYTEKRQADIDK